MKALGRQIFYVIAAAMVFALGISGSATAQRLIKGSLVTENIPKPDANVLAAITRYQNIQQYKFQGWVLSGALVSTRIGRTPQAFLIRNPRNKSQNMAAFRNLYRHNTISVGDTKSDPVKRGTTSLQQVTFFTEPAQEILPSPDGLRFIASRDHEGDELYQGHVFSVGKTKSIAFTEPGTRNTGFVFSTDSRWVAWQGSKSNTSDSDILLAPMDDPVGGRRVLFHGKGSFLVLGFAPDNRTLLISRYISVSHSQLYLLNIATGSIKQLNPTSVPTAYGLGKFTSDGQAVIVQSDEGREFVGLLRIDVKTGKKTYASPALDGDVTDFTLSANGRLLAYAVNIEGQSKLLIARARTGKVIAIPRLPPGVISGLSFDQRSRRLGFTFDGAKHPAAIWVYQLKTTQISKWEPRTLDAKLPRDYRSARLIHYPSFTERDGTKRQIPAYIYRPEKSSHLAAPVIISIHGGPEAQYRPRFSKQFQYWLHELGAVVIAPNVRGSTGYGGNYVSLDDGMLRQDAVKDIGALLDWIKTQKDLDASRVIVHGGSYGGYMVLAALAEYPEKLAGGVDVVGISNFVTFLQNTEDYRKDLRRVEYGDERDPKMRAFLEAISPLNNVNKIRDPLLIVQGQNDPRVPSSESEQMLSAAKANSVPVWFMMATDEGHGFRKSGNVLALRAAEDAFFRMVFAIHAPT